MKFLRKVVGGRVVISALNTKHTLIKISWPKGSHKLRLVFFYAIHFSSLVLPAEIPKP